MISIEEAKKRVEQHRLERSAENVSILRSNGRILAEEITAPFDSPRFDNSAMDGFAVKWEDVESAASGTPVTLSLAGESKAGSPWQEELSAGDAVQINTGAVVPEGADTVIPVEQCESDGLKITIRQVKKKGTNIRRSGEEYRKGDRLLEKGTALNPATVAVLASVGISKVQVFRAPRITLLITGSELAASVHDTLKAGQIYDSNRPMLHSFLTLTGVPPIETIRVEDKRETIEKSLRAVSSESDMIISTGGVSVGPHDHVPAAAEACGFRPVFHKVAQKPGKPLFFATSGERETNTLYFGLPGNPVSAFMAFCWYIYPELCYYLGRTRPFRIRRGTLSHSYDNPRQRSLLLRTRGIEAKGEAFTIEAVEQQGAHKAHALTEAHGFIIVPPQTSLKKGDTVTFYPFPWSEEGV